MAFIKIWENLRFGIRNEDSMRPPSPPIVLPCFLKGKKNGTFLTQGKGKVKKKTFS